MDEKLRRRVKHWPFWMDRDIRAVYLTPSARQHGVRTEGVLGMVKAVRAQALDKRIASSNDKQDQSRSTRHAQKDLI